MWGVRRRPVSYGAGAYDEIVGHPLAGVTEARLIDAHPWPSPDWFDWAGFRSLVLAPDPGRTKARRLALVASGRPLEEYTWMTGLEETLANLLLYPDVVHAALARICDFFCGMQRRAAESCGDLIDLLYFADDLGGQQGLLFSRRDLPRDGAASPPQDHRQREGLFPRAAMMYHTDGAVFDIIPDLLDAGVDVLEAVQVDAAGMDPARLKAAYGDRLVVPGRDRGAVAPAAGRRGDGRRRVPAPRRGARPRRRLHRGALARVQVGTPTANVLAMLRAVLGDADFEQALSAARS